MTGYLAMGGHGLFVWGAYGVALLVLGGLGLLSWRGYRAARAEVSRLEAMAGRSPR